MENHEKQKLEEKGTTDDVDALPVSSYSNIDVPTTSTAGPQATLRKLLKMTGDEKKMETSAPPASEEDVERVALMTPEEMQKWTDIILGKLPGMISDAERVRQRILPSLVKADPTNKQEVMDQLIQLNFLVEITPIVDVFMHADGIKILSTFFESRFADVREAVWLCLTSCVQNNIKFQRHLWSLQLSKTFLDLLEKETEGKVQYKLLSVIGGWLREFDPVCLDLLELGAIDQLLKLSCSEDVIPKVFLRAQRVLSDLFESSESTKRPTVISSATLSQVRKFLAENSESSDFEVDMLKDFLKKFAKKGPECSKLLEDSDIMSFLDNFELKVETESKMV